jgi:hypothetical protein
MGAMERRTVNVRQFAREQRLCPVGVAFASRQTVHRCLSRAASGELLFYWLDQTAQHPKNHLAEDSVRRLDELLTRRWLEARSETAAAA